MADSKVRDLPQRDPARDDLIYFIDESQTSAKDSHTTVGDIVDLATGEANVQSDWDVTDTSSDAYIANKPTLAPSNAEANVQSNWNETSTTSDAYIQNKPGNATGTTAGLMSSDDKAKLDTISQGAEQNIQVDWAETSTTSPRYIRNKPSSVGNVQADWDETDTTDESYINNKPTIPDDGPLDGYTETNTPSLTNNVPKWSAANQITWSPDNNTGTGGGTGNANDTTITLSAGQGLSGGGDFTTNQASPETLTFDVDFGTGSGEVAEGDHTHANATISVAGFMSDSDKTKLEGIENGAEVNVQANWDETSSTSDAFIQNKPTSVTEFSDVSSAGSGNIITATERTKLTNIAENAEVNVQADWNETTTTSDAFIQNKPTDITDLSAHNVTDLSDVTSAGSGSIITADERTKLTGIAANAEVNVQADWDETSTTSDAYIQNKPTTITTAQSTKLDGIATGAEVNVQSDWNVTDSTSDAFIRNKPTVITSAQITKIDSVETGAEVNVQADWDETSTTADAYIQNKPTIPTVNNPTITFTAGDNLSGGGTISLNQTDNETITFNAEGGGNDTTITLNAGSGISGGGDFTTDQATAETITFSHADTSTFTPGTASGQQVVRDFTIDEFGHVTGKTLTSLASGTVPTITATLTVTNNIANTTITTTGGTATTSGTTTTIVASGIEGETFTITATPTLNNDYEYITGPTPASRTYTGTFGTSNVSSTQTFTGTTRLQRHLDSLTFSGGPTFSQHREVVDFTITGDANTSGTLSVFSTSPAGWITVGAFDSSSFTIPSDGTYEGTITIPITTETGTRTFRMRATSSSNADDVVNSSTITQQHTIGQGSGGDNDLRASFDAVTTDDDVTFSVSITAGDAPYTVRLSTSDTSPVPAGDLVETMTLADNGTVTFTAIDTTSFDGGDHTYYAHISEDGSNNDLLIEAETITINRTGTATFLNARDSSGVIINSDLSLSGVGDIWFQIDDYTAPTTDGDVTDFTVEFGSSDSTVTTLNYDSSLNAYKADRFSTGFRGTVTIYNTSVSPRVNLGSSTVRVTNVYNLWYALNHSDIGDTTVTIRGLGYTTSGTLGGTVRIYSDEDLTTEVTNTSISATGADVETTASVTGLTAGTTYYYTIDSTLGSNTYTTASRSFTTTGSSSGGGSTPTTGQYSPAIASGSGVIDFNSNFGGTINRIREILFVNSNTITASDLSATYTKTGTGLDATFATTFTELSNSEDVKTFLVDVTATLPSSGIRSNYSMSISANGSEISTADFSAGNSSISSYNGNEPSDPYLVSSNGTSRTFRWYTNGTGTNELTLRNTSTDVRVVDEAAATVTDGVAEVTVTAAAATYQTIVDWESFERNKRDIILT